MTAQPTVLVVEDDPGTRMALEALLSQDHYRVVLTATGEQGLERALELRPDVVLLDVMLPGMDGFEVCRRIRADATLAEVPVVMLTGLDDQASLLEGIQAGADLFLSKPFHKEELRARLRTVTHLNRYRKLLEERQRAESAQRHLSARLLEAQDQERRQLGRELHDSAGQRLAALSINLQLLQKRLPDLDPEAAQLLKESAEIVASCSEEIRTMSYLLHPPLLDEMGLCSALRWLVDGFNRRSGLSISLEIPEGRPRFPAPLELAIFRAVQEGLTNVRRHSGSATAQVRLAETADALQLEITDQGVGIPAEVIAALQAGRGSAGVGLAGMRERVQQLGGTLDLSADEDGTRLLVRLPLRRADESQP